MIPFTKNKSQPNRPYQICKRCVMDTSDPWIKFDSNGICNHCKTYFEKRFRTKKQNKINTELLNDIFKNIKKSKINNSKYDVAIGISGGVDSSFLTYLAHKAGFESELDRWAIFNMYSPWFVKPYFEYYKIKKIPKFSNEIKKVLHFNYIPPTDYNKLRNTIKN